MDLASFCFILGLENVKLPPKIKKRDKPKEAEKTNWFTLQKRRWINQHHFLKSIQLIKKEVSHITTIMSVLNHCVISYPCSYPALVCQSHITVYGVFFTPLNFHEFHELLWIREIKFVKCCTDCCYNIAA